MGALKDIEVALRRTLLGVLRRFVRRGRPLGGELALDRCKILFVRQDRIGDVLVSTPLLAALKRHHPEATVDFLLSTNNHFVLANEPLVRKRWLYTKRPLQTLRLLLAIRRERYDFIVDLLDNPSVTSTVLCALGGARWNVGLEKENDFVYDLAVPLLSRKETHIVDRLARLLAVFGIDPQQEELAVRYVVAPESEAFAEHVLRERDLDHKPIIGLNISAGSATRFWGTHNFRSLLAQLDRHHPEIPVLVLYKPADAAPAAEIAEPFKQASLSPETRSFDQFAALIRRLTLLVTPDTAAVHLAAAFGVPAVALYVQSDRSLRVWEPYRSEAAIHVTEVDDLSTIPANEVFASVHRLLERAVPGPGGSVHSGGARQRG